MFLETITFLGNDMLIPIGDIQCIYTGYNGRSYKITIKCFSGSETEENFDDGDKMLARYKQLRTILKAK